ncbi:MAG: hypothetical protein OQL19_18410 [Gammaproteobacteria bacterium]|nr:hypothetical protein [Gammaproteobacteria bacterium]
MALFKSYEVAERFKIPKPTARNWSNEKDTWRANLYKELEQVMAAELAKKAEDLK